MDEWIIGKNVKIIPKPDIISWHDITELLKLAYSEKAERGLNYLASQQDEETTRKRVGNGVCLVALADKKLVGTVTLKIYNPQGKNKKWYIGKKYATRHQLAVHPDYKGFGIGAKLREKTVTICYERNIDELLCTTSVYAKKVQKSWKRRGGQFVELKSFVNTNYYSVKIRLTINGKKFNVLYVAIRYNWSAMKCVILKNKNGQKRIIWKKLRSK